MAIQDKATLKAYIDTNIPVGGGGLVSNTQMNVLLNNMVDSYEDIIREYTTVQRNALTPFEGQKIYNTTSNRLEYYSASMWLPCSQKETVAVDCSANPNYPEALVGDQYIVTVAGIIGGGSGKTVSVGDLVYCTVANAGGSEASAGTSWKVCYSTGSTDSPTRYAEIDISSAQLLVGNGTPLTLVAAPGSGKIIVPIVSVWQYFYGTIAYATNVAGAIRCVSGSGVGVGVISGSANNLNTTGLSGYTPVENSEVQFLIQTGNPTAGDGTVTLGVYYKIHTL